MIGNSVPRLLMDHERLDAAVFTQGSFQALACFVVLDIDDESAVLLADHSNPLDLTDLVGPVDRCYVARGPFQSDCKTHSSHAQAVTRRSPRLRHAVAFVDDAQPDALGRAA